MQVRTQDIEQDTSISFGHIPWVAGRPDGYYFTAVSLDINAPVQTVWDLVKNVGEYDNFSHGAVIASLPQGELKVGNSIRFVMYPYDLIGCFLPVSTEQISVVDERRVLAWERKVPFPFSGTTECYRVLEPLDEGRKTRLHNALKIPGWSGFFTHHLMGGKIKEAFNRVNQGIKDRAELREADSTGVKLGL